MLKKTGVGWRALYAVYKPMEGPGKGLMPVFRFEEVWLKEARAWAALAKLDPVDTVALSCSWGIGQKWGLAYVESQAHEEPKLARETLRNFLTNQDVQLKQVVADYASCLRQSQGNRALAFSRYNAGMRCLAVTGYGASVLAKADAFAKQLKEAK